MQLQTGDIILASKNSLIVKFMRVCQKDPVSWGHVLLVKDPNTVWEDYWTVRKSPMEQVFKRYIHYKIIRKKDLTARQKELMFQVAPKLLGHPYGVARIFLQFFDQIFHTRWFTNKYNSVYNQVCSSFVAWMYEMSCRYKFNGISWKSCDPDDIEDDQLAHPELWEVLETRGIQRAR